MTSSNRNPARKRTGRREAIKLGGLALLGGAALSALPDPTVRAEPAQDTPNCCGNQPPLQDSVFTKICNDESAKKYGGGDSDNTYRLAALWLLLTTEDWATYLRQGHTKDQWIAGIATELQIPQDAVTDLWDESRKSHFQTVRAFWQNYTTERSAIYGKRPCIGGKTASDIACLATKAASKGKKAPQ
jgi:hypothetical protein